MDLLPRSLSSCQTWPGICSITGAAPPSCCVSAAVPQMAQGAAAAAIAVGPQPAIAEPGCTINWGVTCCNWLGPGANWAGCGVVRWGAAVAQSSDGGLLLSHQMGGWGNGCRARHFIICPSQHFIILFFIHPAQSLCFFWPMMTAP